MPTNVLHVIKYLRKFVWLRQPVPSMPLRRASDGTSVISDDECQYVDNDIPNVAHIERQYGVSHIQHIKAFQRMIVYETVAKDFPRNMWKGTPKCMEAIEIE